MADLLVSSLKAAGAGLEAQSARIRVVAENLANAAVERPHPGGASLPAQNDFIRAGVR